MSTTRPPIRTRADLAGRRALVLGLARSGIAAARFLADAGADVTIYDRRGAGELSAAVAALGDRRPTLLLGVDPPAVAAAMAGADLLVTSPSISARFPTTEPWLRDLLADATRDGVELVSEVELFLRITRARIAGVTGTKGKTTTATLLAAILERDAIPSVLGGNIGTPLVERADELTRDTWAVLELSELQLPTISRGADVAIYTNIGADHIDRHGSVTAYRAVKARLAELSTPEGTVVLNADDAGCRDLRARLDPAAVRTYGLAGDGDATVREGQIMILGEVVLPVAEVRLPGTPMLHNVLAAALGARLIGASAASIAEAIRTFRGVAHRLETVGEWGDVRFVNDSMATIPAATIAALHAFGDRGVVLIAGGQGKGLPLAEVGDAIAGRVRAVVLIGELAGELATAIADRVAVHHAPDMAAAVAAAAAAAQPGDVVLLAPAAASFDMFDDYVARGEAFRAAARKIGPSLGPEGDAT
ncbi:MAG: UDP-N-acetylmuramoyl-L-alanine--D-glutamate ligase [Chloroflexota bacterium]